MSLFYFPPLPFSLLLKKRLYYLYFDRTDNTYSSKCISSCFSLLSKIKCVQCSPSIQSITDISYLNEAHPLKRFLGKGSWIPYWVCAGFKLFFIASILENSLARYEDLALHFLSCSLAMCVAVDKYDAIMISFAL